MQKVAVLFGGDSPERAVSLRSGQAIVDALCRQSIDVVGIDLKDYLLENLKKEGFTCAFIALHGGLGENGVVQSVLEYLGIPYTGSRTLACALAMNKRLTKKVWKAHGLPVTDDICVTVQQRASVDAASVFNRLGDKLVVKPNAGGSSCGVSIIDAPDALDSALENAFVFDTDVLIEPYLEGAEYTVAIVGTQTYPSIRMETTRDFYDYTAKYESDTTGYFIPSGLNEALEQRIQLLSLEAFEVLECEGWGRVDWLQDVHGNLYLLEMNTVPGMTTTSLVPKAAAFLGVSFDQVVLKILNQAH